VALWTCRALIRCAADDLTPPARRRKLNGSDAHAGKRATASAQRRR
jgi:hypothetical protein